MKVKSTAVLFCMVLALLAPTVHATGFTDVNDGSVMQNAVTTLASLNVLQGYGDDTFQPEKTVSRAEFAVMTVRLLSVEAAGFSGSASYSDVDASHWSYGYINMATQLGIINGFEDGSFRPNDPVTYVQALKMTVNLLGYEPYALRKGGFPQGYLVTASELNLLKNVQYTPEEEVTRGTMAVILFNALDCELMEWTGQSADSDSYQVIKDKTLKENLLRSSGLKYYTGILNAVGFSRIYGSGSLPEDGLELDGRRFLSDVENAVDLLGYQVEIYASQDGEDEVGTVQAINPLRRKNETLRVYGKDLEDIKNKKLTYLEGEKSESATIAQDAYFLYNNRKVSPYTDVDMKTEDGIIDLVDNDNDGEYEVVFLKESLSLPVERVSLANDSLSVKIGEEVVSFNLGTNEKGSERYLHDMDGNTLELKEISKDDVVQIVASKDRSYLDITLLDRTETGTVQEISLSGRHPVLTIGEQSFETLCDITGVKVANSIEYTLNAEGQIVFIKELFGENNQYGVIVASNKSGGLRGGISVKLAVGKTAETEELKDGKIKLNVANDEIRVYSFADKIRFRSGDSQVTLMEDELEKRLTYPAAILYGTNSDGEINSIRMAEPMENSEEGEKLFNDKVWSFGGKGNGAFRTNEDTIFVCVPEGGADSDDDYYVVRDFDPTNSDGYQVQGYEYDSFANAVRLVVYTSEMNAEIDGVISNKTKVAVVDSITQGLNDDGDTVYRLAYYQNRERTTLPVKESASMSARLARLHQGDLFYFSKNSKGEVDKIETIGKASLTPLPDFYYQKKDVVEEMLGQVTELRISVLDDLRNTLVDEIRVSTGNTEELFVMPQDDPPEIYVLDTMRETVSPGGVEDILSYDEAGGDASTVFVYARNNDVKGVVIIK